MGGMWGPDPPSFGKRGALSHGKNFATDNKFRFKSPNQGRHNRATPLILS